MANITRIVQTIAEKDALLVAMVAELLKPEVDRKLPAFCTVFVSDNNRQFTLNAITETAEETVIVAPSAHKISKTVATGGIAQGQKFGLNASGELVKATVENQSTILTSVLSPNSATYKPLTEKLAENKWCVCDGSSTGILTFVKNVDGVISKVSSSNMANAINFIKKIDETRVLVQYGSSARILSIDWTTMVVTLGTAVSDTSPGTRYPQASGIVASDVANEFWGYYIPSVGGAIKKKKYTCTGGTVVVVGAEQATANTTAFETTYYGMVLIDFGAGKANVYTHNAQTPSINMMKISPDGSGGMTETSYIPVQWGVPAATPMSILNFGENRTMLFFSTIPQSTMRAVFSGIDISHNATAITEMSLCRFFGTKIDLGKSAGQSYLRPFDVCKTSDITFDFYFNKSPNVVKIPCTLVPEGISCREEEIAFAATNLRRPQSGYPICANSEAFVMNIENGDSIFVKSTTAAPVIVPLGISDQNKTAGQTAIGTLFGGVATVGTGLTAGEKVYFDETAGVNQTQIGYEIGRAVGATDILTI